MFCLSQPWDRYLAVSPLRLCCEYEGFLLIKKVVAFPNTNTLVSILETIFLKKALFNFSDQLVSIVVSIPNCPRPP